MSKSLLVKLWANPVIYFGGSFILLLFVRYICGLNDYSMATINLYSLCMWNMIIASGVGIFHILSRIFFGSMSGEIQSCVLEDIVSFIGMKFVLVEIILQNNIMMITRWVLWFIILSICKGLMSHGRIHLEELSSSALPWRHYIRPFGHMLCVAGGITLLLNIRYVAIRESPEPWHIALLLFYDVLFLSNNLLLTGVVFGLTVSDSLEILPPALNINDTIYLVDGVIAIVQKVCTLLHFLHIAMINGISLSLVDMVILLNSRSIAAQLMLKVQELNSYFSIKRDIRTRFVTVVGEEMNSTDSKGDYVCGTVNGGGSLVYLPNLSAEVCPICIQPFPRQGKQLPCGHLLHEDCLRTLIQKQTEVYNGPPLNESSEGGTDTPTSSGRSSGTADGEADVASPVPTVHRAAEGDRRSGVLHSVRRGIGRMFGRSRRGMDLVEERVRGGEEETEEAGDPREHNTLTSEYGAYPYGSTLVGSESDCATPPPPQLDAYPLRYVKCPMCRKNVCVATGRLLPELTAKDPGVDRAVSAGQAQAPVDGLQPRRHTGLADLGDMPLHHPHGLGQPLSSVMLGMAAEYMGLRRRAPAYRRTAAAGEEGLNGSPAATTLQADTSSPEIVETNTKSTLPAVTSHRKDRVFVDNRSIGQLALKSSELPAERQQGWKDRNGDIYFLIIHAL